MAPNHTPRFLAIVNEARKKVRECTVEDVRLRLDKGETLLIVDVREESEFARDHIPGAIHLGKGIIERDIESVIPDPDTELYLLCGGGFRSALAADNLSKMGYSRVVSVDGGWRAWTAAGYPVSID